jgi:hypothetical protein
LARGGVAGKGFEAGVLFRSVDSVADEWVANVLEMDADLVGTAGMETAFDESRAVEAFDDLVCGPRFARVSAFGRGHTFAMGWMARDADLDFAAFIRHFTTNDPAINLGDAAFFKLRGEVQVRFVCFRDDDATARIHIEAMDNSGSRDAGDAAELAFAMMQQGVDERAAVMASRGMDDQARRFVDRDDVFIFVKDIQRDLFRLRARGNWFGPRNLDGVAGVWRVSRFYSSSVYENGAVFDHALQNAARGLRQLRFQKDVKTLEGKGLLDDDRIGSISHGQAEEPARWRACLADDWKARTTNRRRSRE